MTTKVDRRFYNKKAVALVLCAVCLPFSSAHGQRAKRKVINAPNADTYYGCKLGLPEAPTLRGFRLGMSLQEVKQKFPKAQFSFESAVDVFKFMTSDSEIPERTLPENEAILRKPIFLHTVFANDDGAMQSEFEGTDEVELYFTGNIITGIKVDYSNPQWWRDHDEFRDIVVKKLALPEGGKYGGGGRRQTLRDGTASYEVYTYYPCRGFEAQIITGYPNILGKKRNPIYALVLLTNEDAELRELNRHYEAEKTEQKRLKEKAERDRARERDAFKP